MVSNYRGRLARVQTKAHSLFMMAESLSVSGSDLKSLLSNRPFQNAKRCGKLVCATCIENKEILKFYYDDTGLKLHFKSKHHTLQLDKDMLLDCRRRFRQLHAEETTSVLKKLSNLRLEKVRI